MSDDVLESDPSLDLGGDKSVCCNTVVRDVDAATKSLAESRWSMVVPPMLYRSKHTSLPQLQIDRLIGVSLAKIILRFHTPKTLQD